MKRLLYTILLFLLTGFIASTKNPYIIKNMNSDKIMYENKICHRNDTISDENRIKWDKPTSVMQVRDIKDNTLRIFRASDSKQYNPESTGYREYIPASVRGHADTEDFEDLAEYVDEVDLFDEWTVKTEFPTDSVRHFRLSYKDGELLRQYNLTIVR